jgi:hypothetical protein
MQHFLDSKNKFLFRMKFCISKINEMYAKIVQFLAFILFINKF